MAFLASDPTQYRDANPFEDKGGNPVVTFDDFEDYAAGVADPRFMFNDDEYVYRGVDEWVLNSDAYGYPAHLGTSPRYHAD